MKNIDDAIVEIINSIPAEHVFDSHAVIFMLIQRDSDIYLSSFTGGTTESYHGIIAQKIASLENSIIQRVGNGKSFSKNVHDNFSECTCWTRKGSNQ